MSVPPAGPQPDDDDSLFAPHLGASGGPDLVGTVLGGRYRILGPLGQGAMGSVYLGEHLKIGRKDAIKVLRGGLATDRESLARFERGARNLSAIRHPNVCTLYDYGETDDGSPFLALEYITGESLKDLLVREGTLSPPRAIDIARQVADALDAAHDAGIVHRDLKPANIMIERGRSGADVVKVVDFDIAKGPDAEGEELTRLGFVVGTPEYMSPEQLAGERLDGRSDLYSLGLVLFRMLTGMLPFKGGTAQDVMIERLTHPALKLEQARPDLNVPADVQTVLDRALVRDRTERYGHAEDFARDLAALASRTTSPPQASARPANVAGATSVIAAKSGTGAAESLKTSGRVPATRVSASTAAGDGESEKAGSSRRMLIGAIIAVAVLGGATGVALSMRNGDDAESNDNQAMGGPTNTTSLPQSPDSGQREPLGQRVGNRDGGRRQMPRESAATQVGGGEPAQPPPRPPEENPDTALIRWLDRLDPSLNAGAVAGAPAVRDSAVAMYGRAQLTAEVRARAAFVAASAFQLAGDDANCVEWMRRALALQPNSNAYQQQLRACGGTRP